MTIIYFKYGAAHQHKEVQYFKLSELGTLIIKFIGSSSNRITVYNVDKLVAGD